LFRKLSSHAVQPRLIGTRSIWFASTFVLDMGIAIGLLFCFFNLSSDFSYSSVNFQRLAFRAGTSIEGAAK
jgi:hypothetical protein